MEKNENKTVGRPKGKGSRALSLADLAEIVGENDVKIPVLYNWILANGGDPESYEKFDTSAVKKTLQKMRKADETKEEEQVEMTLTE